MKNVICYGDSNTFGYIPGSGKRYSKDIRWTGVLAKLKGDGYKIIEEGCNNRTGFMKNPSGKLFCGLDYLPECFLRHPNFDIFIIAIGTNDIQSGYSVTPTFIKDGLTKMVDSIKQKNDKARIIIFSPLILNSQVLKGGFSVLFDESSIERSFWIQDIYQDFCKDNNLELFDVNKYAIPSDIDGLHYSPEEHQKIAKELAKII